MLEVEDCGNPQPGKETICIFVDAEGTENEEWSVSDSQLLSINSQTRTSFAMLVSSATMACHLNHGPDTVVEDSDPERGNSGACDICLTFQRPIRAEESQLLQWVESFLGLRSETSRFFVCIWRR